MKDMLWEKRIEESVRFHGHECPGLWIGIRAAELCLREVGADSSRNPVICVTETDMCGVDAIQVLTGCTFGKGNLVHRDYGKNAFSFFNRADGRAIRVVLRSDVIEREREVAGGAEKSGSGAAGASEEEERRRLREEMCRRIRKAPIEEMFVVKEPDYGAPGSARILQSMLCEECGEAVMESRVRLLGGMKLCLPCFQRLDRG